MQRMPLFKAYKFTFDKELKGNITLKTEYGKEAKWILKNKKQRVLFLPTLTLGFPET